MRYSLLFLVVITSGSAYSQDKAPAVIVRDTLTYFELTSEELINEFDPTAWKPLVCHDRPTIPAAYFKPDVYESPYQIISVYVYFGGSLGWSNSNVEILLCEGSNSSGPHESDALGRPVSAVAPVRHNQPVIADFSDQQIILAKRKGLFVIIKVSEEDGSPFILSENLKLRFHDSGYSWCHILTSSYGWIKLRESTWGATFDFGDWAIYLVVDYLEAPNTIETSSWQKEKSQ